MFQALYRPQQARILACKTLCRLGRDTSYLVSPSWCVNIGPQSCSLLSRQNPQQISLHFIFQSTHEDYGRATSLSTIASHFTSKSKKVDDDYNYLSFEPTNRTLAIDRRANATFVILARNRDIDAVIRSVREIENRFNRNYGYPYVFLNEEPFPEEFKRSVSTNLLDNKTFCLWIIQARLQYLTFLDGVRPYTPRPLVPASLDR